jgi:hypothetical protein
MAENLFLADESLRQLGMDWDSAKAKIIAESVNYGGKAEQLKACTTLDRKTGNFKGVIEEISRILDSQNMFWAIRVGKQLAKERPQGQLAAFLGTDIVDWLWSTGSAQ